MLSLNPVTTNAGESREGMGFWKALVGMQIVSANLKNSLNIFMKLSIYSPHKSTKTERLNVLIQQQERVLTHERAFRF